MIFNIALTPQRTNIPALFQRNAYNKRLLTEPAKLDSFTFTGRSQASDYKDVFEYLASGILDAKAKKYGVDGSMLSASRINFALEDLDNNGRIFQPYSRTNAEKIKWKSYIPQDVRVGSVEKINEARDARMDEWQRFLQNPEKVDKIDGGYNPELVKRIKNNKALKLVIWNAITSELKENNRHIPVPFDEKALLETIVGFEEILPKDRRVRCVAPSFLEMYTHRLRDNLLMEMGLSNNDEVWVKLPSIKHDKHNKEKNISSLETLSCRNWCTRSSVDKAEDALTDGDFYIYLTRNKFDLWEPRVGMTTARGKIDQIQGVDNDNIVPLSYVDEIKRYIDDNGLQCHSAVIDEGPKAKVAIMISEKLNEVDPVTKKTFAKSIKEQDNSAIFRHLGIEYAELPDGKLSISNYRPTYLLEQKRGIAVPYSMFGINEDKLLSNVGEIRGNFVLYNNKNKLYNSTITLFPPDLRRVGGKIVCNENQFDQFGDEIIRVVDSFRDCVIQA
ncbi:MAG: hypothetical protein NC191_04660 [Muribaculaceae bacterium]|nr:hypothetical protein [Muribaculaceae bacterium]